jgi:hypothetical protein
VAARCAILSVIQVIELLLLGTFIVDYRFSTGEVRIMFLILIIYRLDEPLSAQRIAIQRFYRLPWSLANGAHRGSTELQVLPAARVHWRAGCPWHRRFHCVHGL